MLKDLVKKFWKHEAENLERLSQKKMWKFWVKKAWENSSQKMESNEAKKVG